MKPIPETALLNRLARLIDAVESDVQKRIVRYLAEKLPDQ